MPLHWLPRKGIDMQRSGIGQSASLEQPQKPGRPAMIEVQVPAPGQSPSDRQVSVVHCGMHVSLRGVPPLYAMVESVALLVVSPTA